MEDNSNCNRDQRYHSQPIYQPNATPPMNVACWPYTPVHIPPYNPYFATYSCHDNHPSTYSLWNEQLSYANIYPRENIYAHEPQERLRECQKRSRTREEDERRVRRREEDKRELKRRQDMELQLRRREEMEQQLRRREEMEQQLRRREEMEQQLRTQQNMEQQLRIQRDVELKREEEMDWQWKIYKDTKKRRKEQHDVKTQVKDQECIERQLKIQMIDFMEDQLSYLSDECTIISIVFDSVRNAYRFDSPSTTVEEACRQLTVLATNLRNSSDIPLPTETGLAYSPDVIKEIKIAIDELGIQLKQLDKKVKTLEHKRVKLINNDEHEDMSICMTEDSPVDRLDVVKEELDSQGNSVHEDSSNESSIIETDNSKHEKSRKKRLQTLPKKDKGKGKAKDF